MQKKFHLNIEKNKIFIENSNGYKNQIASCKFLCQKREDKPSTAQISDGVFIWCTIEKHQTFIQNAAKK